MDSKLKELLARLGPVRDVDRVSCGSPGVLVLRLAIGVEQSKTVSGALALARRGATLLTAKRAMDQLIVGQSAFVALPTIESRDALLAELAECGIAAAMVEPEAELDVRKTRERLGYSREEFALRYGLELESVRNWEAGRRQPDRAARAYLRAIGNDPAGVERAYAPTPEQVAN